MKRALEDLSGTVFTHLTVLHQVAKRGRQRAWLCRCRCGCEVVVTTSHLKAGDYKSCGCLREEQKTSLAKLLRRVVVDERGCWLMPGRQVRGGYVRRRWKGRSILCHRLFYELHKGEVPDGLIICHTCDVPNCVNPDHLYAGTHKQNTADAINRGRFKRHMDPAYFGPNALPSNTILTEVEVIDFRRQVLTAPRGARLGLMREIAASRGISWRTVRNAVYRSNWKRIPPTSV